MSSGPQIRQLAGELGAEVRGIDLSAPDYDVALVHDLFGQHHALFFPDQQLQPADRVRSMRTLGEPLVFANHHSVRITHDTVRTCACTGAQAMRMEIEG